MSAPQPQLCNRRTCDCEVADAQFAGFCSSGCQTGLDLCEGANKGRHTRAALQQAAAAAAIAYAPAVAGAPTSALVVAGGVPMHYQQQPMMQQQQQQQQFQPPQQQQPPLGMQQPQFQHHHHHHHHHHQSVVAAVGGPLPAPIPVGNAYSNPYTGQQAAPIGAPAALGAAVASSPSSSSSVPPVLATAPPVPQAPPPPPARFWPCSRWKLYTEAELEKAKYVEEASSCSLCKTGFGITTWRHRCRVCAGCFCDACCPKCDDMQEGEKGVRVCDKCARDKMGIVRKPIARCANHKFGCQCDSYNGWPGDFCTRQCKASMGRGVCMQRTHIWEMPQEGVKAGALLTKSQAAQDKYDTMHGKGAAELWESKYGKTSKAALSAASANSAAASASSSNNSGAAGASQPAPTSPAQQVPTNINNNNNNNMSSTAPPPAMNNGAVSGGSANNNNNHMMVNNGNNLPSPITMSDQNSQHGGGGGGGGGAHKMAAYPMRHTDEYIKNVVAVRIGRGEKNLTAELTDSRYHAFTDQQPPPNLSQVAQVFQQTPAESRPLYVHAVLPLVEVVDADTLLRAKQLVESRQFQNICILNMANEFNCGGGAFNVVGAQEEALFRNSTLGLALYRHRSQQQDGHRPWPLGQKVLGPASTDPANIFYPFVKYGVVYTRKVEVFAIDDNLLPPNQVFTVSALSAAAQDLRAPKHLPAGTPPLPFDRDVALNKIRAILFTAALNRVDALVLGAFGCGVFKNEPTDVAQLFRTALEEFAASFAPGQYPFKKVDFAVLKSQKNLDAFRALLTRP